MVSPGDHLAGDNHSSKRTPPQVEQESEDRQASIWVSSSSDDDDYPNVNQSNRVTKCKRQGQKYQPARIQPELPAGEHCASKTVSIRQLVHRSSSRLIADPLKVDEQQGRERKSSLDDRILKCGYDK
jgi:hypothetical protein